MATKAYPLWSPGGPQLRIFLPDFFMKLLRTERKLPPNTLYFHIDMRMTEHDVKNYLTKIYKLPVRGVRVFLVDGKMVKSPFTGGDMQLNDEKHCYVDLARNVKFEWPELWNQPGQDTVKEEKAQYNDMINHLRSSKSKHWDRHNVPTWWGA